MTLQKPKIIKSILLKSLEIEIEKQNNRMAHGLRFDLSEKEKKAVVNRFIRDNDDKAFETFCEKISTRHLSHEQLVALMFMENWPAILLRIAKENYLKTRKEIIDTISKLN